MTILAAGILIIAKDGKALFLKRGPGGDNPGEWCFPGGRIEGAETAIEAAVRETEEEAGFTADPKALTPLARRIANRESTGAPATAANPSAPPQPAPAPSTGPGGLASMLPGEQVDFTTFLLKGVEPFVPDIEKSGEHVAYAWAPVDQPPEPLHPGCRIALDRLTMDELGVARAMMAGNLTSPQRYQNVTLFDLRITGTGVAYRLSLNEFVYRRPEHYLTPEFLVRCNGLPVIWVHPNKASLNSKEFSDRIVGTMMLPYIKGDEVWGIAKIYDDEALTEMMKAPLSTSPMVVLRAGGDNSKMTLEDGSTLLIEGKPSLLDHLAIVARGVWDKGGEPSGVANTEVRKDSMMTEEEMAAADKAKKDAEEEAKKKADAEGGEKLDKVLKGIDSMSAMCDALTKRMDAMEADGKARRDAEEKAKADAAMTEDEKKVADAKRKDAEDKAEKDKADAAEDEKRKADAQKIADASVAPIAARIADVEKRLPMSMTDADHAAMADAQARADDIYGQFGERAPRPLDGETVPAYRLRALTKMKPHSKAWKDVDLAPIAADLKVLEIAEGQIYADAMTAANHPTDIAPGQLLERVVTDRTTGHRTITFVGSNTFIAGLKRPARHVQRFNLRQDQ